MVNAVSRTFPLNLVMKSMHFQVKKRLSFEFSKSSSWAKRISTAKCSFSVLSAKENLVEHQHQSRALSAR